MLTRLTGLILLAMALVAAPSAGLFRTRTNTTST